MRVLKAALVVVLGLGSVACGAPAEEGGTEPIGQAGLALTATTPTLSTYRLNRGSVIIYDNSGQRVAKLAPAPNAPVSAKLKPGAYFATLEAGWVIQRQVESTWVDVVATVTAQPVGKFMIHPKKVTELTYQFETGFTKGTSTEASPDGTVVPTVPGATGTAVVKIAFDDCGLYVGKISSLASFTVACLGRVDGTQYSVSGGTLVRNFSNCTVGTSDDLASIDGVLSLQYDRPDLEAEYPTAARDITTNKAFAATCITTEWQEWQEAYDPTEVNVCPDWELLSVLNPPETGAAAVVEAGLPPSEVDEETETEVVAIAAPNLVAMQKSDLTYQVSFPEGSPTPNCGTAAECAAKCAAGFRGFVLSTNGEDQVVVDPPYWESETRYATIGENPYLQQGYYHAMADYGPSPGDQFGHSQRARAYQDRFGRWIGEPCSYYLGSVRYFTKLIYTSGRGGAVSWCTPDP